MLIILFKQQKEDIEDCFRTIDKFTDSKPFTLLSIDNL